MCARPGDAPLPGSCFPADYDGPNPRQTEMPNQRQRFDGPFLLNSVAGFPAIVPGPIVLSVRPFGSERTPLSVDNAGWMGGRAVEGTGLENRQRFTPLVGSNPTPSATTQARSDHDNDFMNPPEWRNRLLNQHDGRYAPAIARCARASRLGEDNEKICSNHRGRGHAV